MIDPAVGGLLAGALGLLFAGGALHKLLDLRGFAAVFRAYRVLPEFLAPLSFFLPLLELAAAAGLLGVAAAVLSGAMRIAVTAVAAVLLLAYAGAIAVNLGRGRRGLSCGCGGLHAERPIAAWMVWRNLALTAVLAVLLLPRTARPPGAADALTIAAGAAVTALIYMSIDNLLGRVAATRVLARGTP